MKISILHLLEPHPVWPPYSPSPPSLISLLYMPNCRNSSLLGLASLAAVLDVLYVFAGISKMCTYIWNNRNKINKIVLHADQVQEARISMKEACNLLKPPLQRYEMFWEKSLDTKCLLAWNAHHIVLSFRGTASLSNVKADLQVWTFAFRVVDSFLSASQKRDIYRKHCDSRDR